MWACEQIEFCKCEKGLNLCSSYGYWMLGAYWIPDFYFTPFVICGKKVHSIDQYWYTFVSKTHINETRLFLFVIVIQTNL